jgi:Putative zinc-finger/FecR protein
MSHVSGLIDDVLTGRVLSASDDAAFREHLRGCEPCRHQYDQGVGLLRLARGGAEAMGPGELERTAVRAVRLSKPMPASFTFPWRIAFSAAALAAALVLTVLAWPKPKVGSLLSASPGLTVNGIAAGKDMALFAGAQISTEREDAALLLSDDTEKRGLLLRPSTKLTAWSPDEVALDAGRVRVQVRRAGAPFQVRVEALRVVQRTAGVFIVEKRMNGTLVAVHQGTVVVRGSGTEVELKEGQELELTAAGLSPARPAQATALIEDRGDGTVWNAIVRFLRQLMDVIAKALAGD